MYDQDADFPLEKAIQIISIKETIRLVLQELKSTCVDFPPLIQAVKREFSQTPTVESKLGSIEQGAVYSKMGTNCGLFIKPYERFMFKGIP